MSSAAGSPEPPAGGFPRAVSGPVFLGHLLAFLPGGSAAFINERVSGGSPHVNKRNFSGGKQAASNASCAGGSRGGQWGGHGRGRQRLGGVEGGKARGREQQNQETKQSKHQRGLSSPRRSCCTPWEPSGQARWLNTCTAVKVNTNHRFYSYLQFLSF